MIDDETQARIQEFTSWASGKGLQVIGGLIGPKGTNKVQVFCTTPAEGAEDHAKRLVEFLYHAVTKGSSSNQTLLPLGSN